MPLRWAGLAVGALWHARAIDFVPLPPGWVAHIARPGAVDSAAERRTTRLITLAASAKRAADLLMHAYEDDEGNWTVR